MIDFKTIPRPIILKARRRVVQSLTSKERRRKSECPGFRRYYDDGEPACIACAKEFAREFALCRKFCNRVDHLITKYHLKAKTH